jgi:serine phosphatase RsbU (regulator of sigma subunit)
LIEQHHQISAAELADRVLNEVDWFSQSAPLSDDRTLVVMKVK